MCRVGMASRGKKNISTVYGTTTRPWKTKKRGDYGCGGDITSEEELWSLQSIKQQLATQAAIDFCPGTPAQASATTSQSITQSA